MWLFFTPLRYPVPDKERKAETFASLFEFTVGGKKVQGYLWGEGLPVWVVHGWAGRATQFRRFIKPFNQAGYQVVGFDGPAHGNSEGKRTTIMEFEEALIKLAERTGPPVAVIAHSFGGGASLYATMNGLPIRKLIMIATPTIGDEIINTYLKAINGSPKTGDQFKAEILDQTGKSFDQFTSTWFVKHLPHPVALLLVHDEEDAEVSIGQQEALVDLYPSAKLMRTSGLGHTRILRDDGVIRSCVTFVRDPASV
jgi:esterase/lipase